MKMHSSEYVRPLHLAENEFLEILITDFLLKRYASGVCLRVRFDRNTPAVWSRKGKQMVLGMIPNFSRRAAEYQRSFDRFLIEEEGEHLEFHDSSFPFRYASGGTLPIVRMSDEDYYCLFYRDVFPIGWNIANGGTDNSIELLNPQLAIDRELREELIILDIKNRKRYVFKPDEQKPLDWPEFRVARRIWIERYKGLNIEDFEELVVPLKKIYGPDFIEVSLEGQKERTTADCFLNINAEDFGIEIDQIAKLNLKDSAILCDGEIEGNDLLDRPVGLFNVKRLDDELRSLQHEYIPDVIFYYGKRHDICDGGGRPDVHKFQAVVNEFIDLVSRKYSDDRASQWKGAEKRYDLCPVSHRIIRRYQQLNREEPVKPSEAADLFVSFGGKDEAIARQVYEYFIDHGRAVFFSKENRDVNFGRAIEKALETARDLIAVGSSPHHLNRPWPEFEWRSFHQDIRCGVKSLSTSRLISFISGFEPGSLPGALRYYQSVKFLEDHIEEGLSELARYLS